MADILILTSPPRETPQAGMELYAPLAEKISKITGRKVIYRHPGNWLRYQRDMRRDVFDIVFDGPHFASWRIKYYDHQPIAKLPGNLQFFLITLKNNETINTPRDLAAHKICVIPPPNLASLLLLARLDGPAREPIIKPSRNMKDVYRGLLYRECDAAMMRDSFYSKKLTDTQRSELKIIYKSPRLPNQVITLGNKLTTEEKSRITDAILYGSAAEESKSIIQRFSGKHIESFLPASDNEFREYSELLENVILGWKKDQDKDVKASLDQVLWH